MTPEERAAEIVRLIAEIETVTARIVPLINEIATRQVQLDRLTAARSSLCDEARRLLPDGSGVQV